jgi:uncharacterized membrane protein YfcA
VILDPLQYGLGLLSGAFVGFALGMFGGGGSILAMPLMVYLVGVVNPHVAIGTSAFAVAINAATGLVEHACHGTVKWRCATLYGAAGVLGALVGSSLGRDFDGQKLLLLFAVLMLVVGVRMFRSRLDAGDAGAEYCREKAPKLIGFGAMTGVVSGFFGIGGGFLIVPGLIASTGMPIINAVGSSLVVVFAFGLTTALNYAYSGLISWPLANLYIVGGIVGGQLGCFVARRISASKGVLNMLFASLIFAVAFYMIYRGVGRLT